MSMTKEDIRALLIAHAIEGSASKATPTPMGVAKRAIAIAEAVLNAEKPKTPPRKSNAANATMALVAARNRREQEPRGDY